MPQRHECQCDGKGQHFVTHPLQTLVHIPTQETEVSRNGRLLHKLLNMYKAIKRLENTSDNLKMQLNSIY